MLPEGSLEWSGVDAPVASEGIVYYSRLVDDDAGQGSFEAFGIDPSSQEETRLTRSATIDAVAAAAGGRVLVWVHSPNAIQPTLSVVSVDGQPVYENPDVAPFGHHFGNTAGGARHSFDGIRALARDNGGGVYLIDLARDEVTTIDLEGRQLAFAPVLSANGVVYAATSTVSGSATYEIFIYTVENGSTQLTDTPERESYPCTDGEDIYWVTEEAIYRRQGQEPPRRIHEGNCGAPHAADGLVVFACKPNDAQQDPSGYPMMGTDLFVYDGNETHRITASGREAYVHSPRVSSWGVAWFEYDDPDAMCNNQTPGRLMYFDFAYGRAVVVDSVGVPCLCCGALWPNLTLQLDENLLAWNYSRHDSEDDGEPTRRGGGYAYAVIERSDDCR